MKETLINGGRKSFKRLVYMLDDLVPDAPLPRLFQGNLFLDILVHVPAATL